MIRYVNYTALVLFIISGTVLAFSYNQSRSLRKDIQERQQSYPDSPEDVRVNESREEPPYETLVKQVQDLESDVNQMAREQSSFERDIEENLASSNQQSSSPEPSSGNDSINLEAYAERMVEQVEQEREQQKRESVKPAEISQEVFPVELDGLNELKESYNELISRRGGDTSEITEDEWQNVYPVLQKHNPERQKAIQTMLETFRQSGELPEEEAEEKLGEKRNDIREELQDQFSEDRANELARFASFASSYRETVGKARIEINVFGDNLRVEITHVDAVDERDRRRFDDDDEDDEDEDDDEGSEENQEEDENNDE